MEKILSAFLILIGLNIFIMVVLVYRGCTGKTGRFSRDKWDKYND